MPDIIGYSIPAEVMNQIFWQLFNMQQEGQRIEIGVPVENLLGNEMPVVFLPVDPKTHTEFMTWTRWFHLGQPFEAVQMIWPDREMKFPWEPGFDAQFDGAQIDLTGGDWAGRR